MLFYLYIYIYIYYQIPNEVSANHDIKLTNNTSGKKD